MQSPIRTLLVGVGTRGKHWARIMHDESRCEVVGYMDVSPDNLAAINAEFPVPEEALFTDLDAALAGVEADLVVLATPPMGHLEQARKIFDSGRDLLAEKPLAVDLAEAVEIVRLADATGRKLTVGLNFRYQEATMAAKRMFDEGTFGAPSFAQYTYWTNRDGKRPGINKYPLTMHQPMLYEQSIHHLDQFRFTYDREVVRVSAVTHNPPWSMYEDDASVFALLEMEGGLLVNYFGTWSGETKQRWFSWRTDCPEGAVWQREMFRDLAIVRKGSDTPEPVDLPEQESLVDDARAMFTDICDQLLAGVDEPVPSGRDHIKTLALTVACEESSKTHAVVEMAEFYARHGIPAEWL
jgi:predicted dehydrogenase